MIKYRIMEDFVDSLSDMRAQDRLADAIRGSGAFRRFRDTAFRLGLIDNWYAFKHEAFKEKAREWCEHNGLEYEDPFRFPIGE